MSIKIPCLHETDNVPITQTVSDYHPLSKDEIRELLVMATATDACTRSQIQCRLNQGIKGIVCPHEIKGEVAERQNRMDTLYVNTAPQNLASLVDEFDSILNGDSRTAY